MSNTIALKPYFQNLEPSPTLHINERVKQMWRDGETVYHLGFGESRFAVHPRLAAALGANAHSKSYLPARGLPALHEAVASYYRRALGLDIKPAQIMIGPGSKALIYALQMALQAPLYLPAASWVSYAPQAAMLGKPVTWIPSDASQDFRLNLPAFEQLLAADDSAQKLLIINTPNNPTGVVMDDDLLAELATVCRQHNVLVLSDEIYFRVAHPDFDHRSIAHHYPEGSFILGGLSKHLSIGGWRLGVAVLPESQAGAQLMGALTAIASETWSAVTAPLQEAAVVAYSGDDDIEQYVDTCTQIHTIRTRYLRERLVEMGITCTPSQGAFYITASFDHWADRLAGLGIHTSGQLALHLLDQHRIASLPGEPFGLAPQQLSLRLATSYLDMESDDDARRLLDLHLGGMPPQELMSAAQHPNLHACVGAFARFVEGLGPGYGRH